MQFFAYFISSFSFLVILFPCTHNQHLPAMHNYNFSQTMRSLPLAKRIMRSFVAVCAIALVFAFTFAQTLEAQSSRPRRFSMGIYGAYGLDMHNANFLDLPTRPIFRPRTGGSNEPGPFSNANAWNPAFGITMEYMVTQELGIALRGHFAFQNARLTTRSQYRVGRDDGTFDDGVSEFSLETDVQMISLEPMAQYNIWEGLFVHLGARLNFITQIDYLQYESLIAPEDGGFFTNGSRTRNVSSGELPEATKFSIAPIVGLSYAIPIIDRLTVHPEVFYSFGLFPVAGELAWTVNSLRPGLAVKYKF